MRDVDITIAVSNYLRTKAVACSVTSQALAIAEKLSLTGYMLPGGLETYSRYHSKKMGTYIALVGIKILDSVILIRESQIFKELDAGRIANICDL